MKLREKVGLAVSKETELAWCAGFFDGEGTTCLLKTKRDKNIYLRMSIAQKDEETLLRFQQNIGGAIYKSKTRDIFSLNIYSNENVVQALTLLWPYLGSCKKAQANKSIEQVLGIERTLT